MLNVVVWIRATESVHVKQVNALCYSDIIAFGRCIDAELNIKPKAVFFKLHLIKQGFRKEHEHTGNALSGDYLRIKVKPPFFRDVHVVLNIGVL